MRLNFAPFVADPVPRVQPEVRSRLSAAGKRDQEIIGDLFLGHPELIGASAVNVYEQRRVIDDLMNVHVHRSRDLRDSLTEFFSDLVILWIMAQHMNLKRREKTRVKNSADDNNRHAEKCVVG